jgi:hypothetical protein
MGHSMLSDAQRSLDLAEADSDETSAPFVGKWNRLVSRTNWEKGRIICEWRDALVDAERAAYEYSDEAWAARVGGISAQHVGRLRRVWQRFGSTFEQYDGLYWSHFLVAMDWDDAEMWLEGAAQSGWSVSRMRAARWEAVGAPDEWKPRDEDILSSDWDEDSPLRPVGDAIHAVHPEPRGIGGNGDQTTMPAAKGTRERGVSTAMDEADDDQDRPARGDAAPPPVRPFASLPELPDDLTEAFEQFKIAILAHRRNGWREISCDHVVAALDALTKLALAPLDTDSE